MTSHNLRFRENVNGRAKTYNSQMSQGTLKPQNNKLAGYLSYVERSAAFYYWTNTCGAAFLALNLILLFFTIDYSFSPYLFIIVTVAGALYAVATGLIRAYKSMRPPKIVRMLAWFAFIVLSAVCPIATLCLYAAACVINRRLNFRSVTAFAHVFVGPYLAIAILICLRVFIQARYIPSVAMAPTLQIGDRIVVESVTSKRGTPVKRGQIVLFKPPYQERDEQSKDRYAVTMGELTGLPCFPNAVAYIKRAIALPGEKVEIRSGDGVYINGSKLDESSYLANPGNYSMKTLADIGGRSMSGELVHPYEQNGPVVVPPNMVFVLGDDRDNSEDSHVFGFVDQRKIIGRAWVMFYPIQSYMHDPGWGRPK